MRLIDADALEARMYHDAFEVDSDMQKWDSGCWIRYKMFENAIEEAPTIEERKKGKWIIEPHTKGMYIHRCSECMKVLMLSPTDQPKYNYCPNCGADMRGENDGE